MPEELLIITKPTPSRRLPRPWPAQCTGVESSEESGEDRRILKAIRGVCLDIDDTLSTHGQLTDEAFTALWRLKQVGFYVIPITGRPAGWCDHIARFWPVNAVIGENGAFSFYMEQGVRKKLHVQERGRRPESIAKLLQLQNDIQKQFPQAVWASDQLYREYDLAIDICEDVTPWVASEVARLLQFCHDQGAHAKLSSIHVNAWFGDYDKKIGFQSWLSQGAPGCPGPAPELHEWLYIGDSPNDEPLFEFFPYSVGVANLSKYLGQLQHVPRWMTAHASGAGFVEMTNSLISLRR